jgi:hypothetical protein
MINLSCRFGVFSVTSPLPTWLTNQRDVVASTFLEGSSGQISLDTSILSTFDASQGTGQLTVGQLYGALNTITLNSTTDPNPQNIGVLFADTFAGRSDIFGLMFNPGPNFPGLSNPLFDSMPRQGCAVFLGAIAAARTPGDAYEQETLFTTQHELGHVFNLWHLENTNNLMFSSANLSVPLGPNTDFDQAHKSYLAECSDPQLGQFVRPGGSPFGQRGSLGPADNDSQNAPSDPKSLSLEISLSEESFFCFYPVELDIEVSSSANRSATLADKIDPGYTYCEIWLEEPDGECRKFRSPQSYCDRKTQITVTSKTPFRRDITIFGDANGFFFRKPGKHRLWMVLRFSDSTSLKSNILEFQILSASDSRAEHDQLAPLLLQPKVAQLLYYRFASPSSKETKLLQKHVSRYPGSRVTGPIHYALGRLFMLHAEQSTNKRKRSNMQRLGLRHLEKSIASGHLSQNARLQAQRAINT